MKFLALTFIATSLLSIASAHALEPGDVIEIPVDKVTPVLLRFFFNRPI